MANIFTAGPARALFFYGQQLIGVGKTLSETTFDASVVAPAIYYTVNISTILI